MLTRVLAAAGLWFGFATAMAAPYPEIDFSTRPSYLPNNAVALTFDDGPDWQNTERVLNILRDKGVKATFFINSENWSSLTNDAPMRELVRRMVNEGHELANHTMAHHHLPTLSAGDIDYQISHVENVVKSILGAQAPRLTLLRAPHGEPYQGHNPAAPSAAYNLVAPVVAKHAVHIGWAVDSLDYECPVGDGQCVYNNVTRLVQTPGRGAYGQILMHSVHSQTANALPALIDYLRNNGFQFWSTEAMVRARYGKSSAELVDGTTGPTNPPTGVPAGIQVGGVYELVARHSGRCVDVAEGGNPANGTSILQWDCWGGGNQKFRLENAANGAFRLVNIQTNKCMDVAGVNAANGANIHQWDCIPNQANQSFRFVAAPNGSYKLKFEHSGRCLDVKDVSVANGANMHQWDCLANQANQEFFFRGN